MLRTCRTILCVFLLALVGGRLFYAPAEMAAVVRDGIQQCLQRLIPTLFGSLVLAELLVRTGFYRLAGRLLRPMARWVFHLSETEFSVFLLSQVTGYPVGVSMLRAAVAAGEIPPERSRRLMLFCFHSGPAFLLGIVGTYLFASPAAGWLVYGANLSANLLLALVLRCEKPTLAEKPALHFSAEALVQAARAASGSLCSICGLVLVMQLFGAAIQPLHPEQLPAMLGMPPALCQPFCAGLLEISQLSSFPRFQTLALPLLAALTGFGGICVFFQLCAVGGADFPRGRFLLARLAAALLSAGICRLLQPWAMQNYTVSVWSGTLRATAPEHPLLPAILLAMAVILAGEWKKPRKKPRPV